MKKLFLPLLVLTFCMSMTACQKCAECTCLLGFSADFCTDEFDSKDDYNDAVKIAEDNGCTCTQKLKGS